MDNHTIVSQSENGLNMVDTSFESKSQQCCLSTPSITPHTCARMNASTPHEEQASSDHCRRSFFGRSGSLWFQNGGIEVFQTAAVCLLWRVKQTATLPPGLGADGGVKGHPVLPDT